MKKKSPLIMSVFWTFKKKKNQDRVQYISTAHLEHIWCNNTLQRILPKTHTKVNNWVIVARKNSLCHINHMDTTYCLMGRSCDHIIIFTAIHVITYIHVFVVQTVAPCEIQVIVFLQGRCPPGKHLWSYRGFCSPG
ncbi:hypothetical protein AGOR_G00103710 [Albula goreensis]|uniref:Uncharacterized protein n=1 Tax=Albula goreensis TaxID=1534307 RepID=A0A8T3DLP0_9TELE|nr:hypothetical protein AGOR_G00103710 [Albula goreensis]